MPQLTLYFKPAEGDGMIIARDLERMTKALPELKHRQGDRQVGAVSPAGGERRRDALPPVRVQQIAFVGDPVGLPAGADYSQCTRVGNVGVCCGLRYAASR